jgi:putative ABC transport system permease protein
MLKNYFKIAFRNLWRKRSYSFINVIGLAVGMACCFLISLYVLFEFSYDRFHSKADRIYRVVGDLKSSSETLHWYQMPGPLGRSIKTEFPQVQQVARFISGNVLIRKGNFKCQEPNTLWADSSFFSVFDFPLKYGDPRTALKEPNSIVFSETAALKYFGHANPVGQHLFLTGRNFPGVVTGVMKDIPENSHIKADMLVSISTYQSMLPGIEEEWGSYLFSTYLLLAPGADPALLQSGLPALVQKYEGQNLKNINTSYTLWLEPLQRVYLHSSYGAPVTGNLNNVHILTAIALFLLLIACVNFVNLTTARSVERAKEVGIRKCAGAKGRQLIGQFLIESMLVAVISFVLALALCHWLLPLFNQLAGKMISHGIFENMAYPLGLLGLALGIGLLAGVYPALVLSSFKPVVVLKGHYSSGSRGVVLRKVLVVTQFTISITLIVSTLVVYSQMDFMRRQPLGFNKDQVLIVANSGDPEAREFKKRIGAMPSVVSSSLSSAVPGRTYNSTGNDVWPTDIGNNKGEMQRVNLAFYNVDADFIPLYQLRMLAGRNFYPGNGRDSVDYVILNKTAVLGLGYSDSTLTQVIGKPLRGQGEGKANIVIGVVDDFHFHSLREAIQPLCLQTGQGYLQYLSIKINTGHLPATIQALAGQWAQAVPNRPFTYFFLDEDFNSQYRAEESFGQLFFYFSFLALFLSSLGLLGLSSYSTLQRTREIGIRKVLGASVSGIVGLLSGDFVKLVFLAFLIACPISWLAMHQWLEGFAYRITLNSGIFMLAGAGALLIALLTISVQAVKAALANPVKSLRTE